MPNIFGIYLEPQAKVTIHLVIITLYYLRYSAPRTKDCYQFSNNRSIVGSWEFDANNPVGAAIASLKYYQAVEKNKPLVMVTQ